MDEKAIVDKIKKIRTNQGLSLKALAERTGLTQGYLSRIENSDSAPPISTLGRIAKGLGTDVSYLLVDHDGQGRASPAIVVTRTESTGPATAPAASSSRSGYGYHYRALAEDKAGKNMETYVMTPEFEPGEVMQHEGEEFLYILDGEVEFNYGDEKIILHKGDSAYFDAHIPHNGRSLGREMAKVLAVVYNYKRI
ncbi:MAG: helix-turn-helix transcriptional regulator [Deltaproteobacteria bacterium]|nr:helix-turn-helix transcriptional regulator [Deltaproteobacteria bacterium]